MCVGALLNIETQYNITYFFFPPADCLLVSLFIIYLSFSEAPYKQDMMLDLLAQRLQPGGRLYIVGLEPIPDSYGTPPNSPQAIISDVRRIRDACILLAGDRCYREYPVEWIERQLHSKQAQPPSPAHTNDSTINNHSNNTPRLHWLASKQFPILYSHRTIVKQIEVARKKLPQIPSKALARELSNTLRELELRSYAATEQISKTTRIQCGFDYVYVVVFVVVVVVLFSFGGGPLFTVPVPADT